jgi:hypothetical protein
MKQAAGKSAAVRGATFAIYDAVRRVKNRGPDERSEIRDDTN